MMSALLEGVYEGDVTYAELATQAVLEQAEVLSEVWAVA
jgi:hypothetical protein